MPNASHFHFTIGPVQGFIAQARRTRDFWAGSFLLSWLSGVAMLAVRTHDPHSKIIFPMPDDAIMSCISPQWPNQVKLSGDSDFLRQGSVPNRFMAKVSDGFDGRVIVQAVQDAFASLARALWAMDFKKINADEVSLAIWHRQLSQFWDMQWVVNPSDSGLPDNAVLDLRKHWRSNYPPTEPGVKCSLMDGWQELSGAKHPSDPQLVNFWTSLRQHVQGTKHATDLDEGEHLCAMSWIKRRLTRVFTGDFSAQLQIRQLNLRQSHAVTLKGWQLSGNVPSVVYVAARPWLAVVLANLGKKEISDAAKGLVQSVQNYETAHYLPGHHSLTLSESESRLIDRKLSADPALAKQLAALDGGVFFDDALQNRRLFAQDTGQIRGALRSLKQAITDVGEAAGPSPFYALLRMDGDSVGQSMQDRDWQAIIARAYNAFTQRVVGITKAHHGFLIYAGGDDVLALFAVPDAIAAADALRIAYGECFAAEVKQSLVGNPNLSQAQVPLTLSGAIIFAHMKAPLTAVIGSSYDLLVDVAKQKAGRNALAIRVDKPGGSVCEWVSKWPQAGKNSAPLLLQQLASRGELPFSTGFLQRLREMHHLGITSGAAANSGSETQLVLAELLSSRRRDGQPWKTTEARAALSQLMPLLRQPGANSWQPDGAVLMRFLAQKGDL